MKPLDDFDIECIVRLLGQMVFSPDGLDAKQDARLRSRIRRFVLTHPYVGKEHRKILYRAMNHGREQ